MQFLRFKSEQFFHTLQMTYEITINLNVQRIAFAYEKIWFLPFGKCFALSTFSSHPLTSVEVGVACSAQKVDGGGFV